MTLETSMNDPIRFVVDEGNMLNEARYADWIALFAPDGHYWVPLDGDKQTDPLEHVSIAYEDRILLSTRVRRIQGPRAHSMEPGIRSMHVLQQPVVDSHAEGNDVFVRTPFMYTEVRGERQTQLAGVWRHRLRRTPDGLTIVLKRVDLLNANAAHEAILLFP